MATITYSGYQYHFLARFVIEAKTPLAVGSGEKDIITDALVATDVNGLPYIPGTAITGVVRSMLDDIEKFEDEERFKKLKDKDKRSSQFFGYQDKNDGGRGSEIIFTEAKILNSKGEVIDGMDLDARKDSLLQYYDELPIRQHVRINERGVTDNAGKFDEQVVFAGTRFCFEIEMLAKDKQGFEQFNSVLQQIQSQTFRMGSGTRCGFGEIEVVDLQTKTLNLQDNNDLQVYLGKSSSLNSSFWNNQFTPKEKVDAEGWTKYELHLTPEDFFSFGSGFGDDDVDMTPVKERKVKWNKTGTEGKMSKECVLIPATSVKGALAHRVVFHWNRLKQFYAGNPKAKVGNDNPAVQVLFGYENQEQKKQVRGNLIFSDVIETNEFDDKILNHVAIDRFTGGAMDGALFSEKTTYGKGRQFTMTILANKTAIDSGQHIRESFENALQDICKGLLPLGGGVNRGNGVFTGSLYENNVEVYPQDKRNKEANNESN